MSSRHQSTHPDSTEGFVMERRALRRRAEDAYRDGAADLSGQLSSMSPEALHHALHELGVHQVELEMQNEELRRTQDERDASQARYFDFYDMAPVGYCTVSGSGLIEQVNLTAAALLGRERKLLVQQRITDFIRPDDQDSFYLMRQKIIETCEPQSCELRFLKQDGKQFWAHLNALAVPDQDGAPILRVVMTDITARKLAELALRDSNAYLENLINYAHAPIIVWDSQLRITRFNRAIELLSGRSEASVIGQSIEFLFPTEQSKKYMALIRQTIAGVQLDKVEIDVQHKDRSIRNVEWNSATLMQPDGKMISSVIAQGVDITARKRAEEAIKRSITELKNALLSTVNVITTMGAMRDPYTAAHSRRVGDIAMAIGIELGFDVHQQEGIRIAGYLHDIGKISIPTEILSKPGQISPIEYRLIQEHAQVGYEMLKDLQFPWEIAPVALQHHERMDGSGYPSGLKAEAINLKARVVAVADVVESMSSHRPYRPAHGIEQALAEIERGRGTLFDADVVDACLRLFREKSFVIPA